VRLDVPVDDASLVQISERFEDLPKDFPLGLFLFSPGVILKKVLEGLTFTVLHLNVQNTNALGRVDGLLVRLILKVG
jgi:hypothetical protein